MARGWFVVLLAIGFLQGLIASPARADGFFSHFNPKTWFPDRPPREVIVADPYLELHTGPGVGYPIFHVVGRDEKVEIVKRRTDWFYVRTERQIEGWASREQMLATLEVTGQPVDVHEPSRADFTTRRWEGGAFAGRFGGASVLSIFAGYGLSDHLTSELTVSEALGGVSDSTLLTIGLNHTFAPEWLISPYAGIGTGVIRTSPHVTLIRSTDSTDQMGYVSGGVRGYLARRFLWRFEYRGNVVFTSRNENEEIHEWKLGFAFFF